MYGGSTFESNSSQFIQNTAQNRGGAIYNGFRTNNGFVSSHVSVNRSSFKENTAGTVKYGQDGKITEITNGDGGAIYNGGVSTLVSENNTFDGNKATYGGAIYNGTVFEALTSAMPKPEPGERLATLIFSGTNNLVNNIAEVGGALVNRNYIQDDISSVITFKENTALFDGGAFLNVGGMDVKNPCDAIAQFTGTVNFIENKALKGSGGAIANYSDSTPVDGAKTLISFEGVTVFDNNQALEGAGGAIFNKMDLQLIGSLLTFKNNKAIDGGALANLMGWTASHSDIQGETVFSSNKATGWGGAIYNECLLEIGGKVTFEKNEGKYGGAIANSNYQKNGTVIINGDSLFSENSASWGGAIYNNAVFKFEKGNRIFKGNISTNNGGAIYNSGTLIFGGDNLFESNTAKGEANDIFNSGKLFFGADDNIHNITVLNGGVTGPGTMELTSGHLSIGSGAQIHQTSFSAKAGTMTTVVLNEAHHVHDKNIAHFDELADENGTGHDKVATAVTNNGFGIHTTGQMTLEKGAILNIVSDDIQAGHTYLVAYNEETAEPQVAKMVRVAESSVVVKPAGFEHDETSWKGENLISSNPLVKLERVEGDNTNGYILVTSKNSNSISIIEDLAGLDQVYFSWLSDLEDLRQRLGEVRLGADNGIWTKVSYARYRASGLGDGKVKSTDYSIHVGADGTLYKNNGHKFFAGLSFKGGHTDMKAARAAGTGDLNHYTWKLYGTYVHEKGSYADILASVGTFNNRFRGYHDSWTGQVHGDVNNWGAGISGEVGHQFRFLEESAGSFWFAEPQIQLSYFRVKGKNYETSNAIHVEQKSVNFLTGRVGVSAGKQFAYGADKKRYLQLSAKAGLIHEFAGDQKLRLNDKKLSADGKKNLFYYGADMDWQFADNHKLYLKVDRATGSGYRKDIQIQGGYRYSF